MAETEEVIIRVRVDGAEEAEQDIDKLGDGVEETKKKTKEYNQTLGQTAKELKVFGVSIGSLTQAFGNSVSQIRNSVRGLKAWKVALAATGIGLILIALGSLVSLFSKSQKGLDLMTKAFDAFKAVMDVVITRFIRFGEGLVAFFSGDFAIGIDQMGEAFKGMGTEIAIVVDNSLKLSDAQAELERQQIAFISREAKLRQIRKEENRDAEDITKSLQERVAASKRAEAAENERASTAIRLAKEELRLLEARNAQGESTNEDLREEQLLRAAVFRIQEESAEFLTTQGNKTRLLQQQIAAEEHAARQAAAADIVGIETQTAIAVLGIQEASLEGLRNIKKQEIDLEEQASAFKIAIAREEALAKGSIFANLAAGLANLLGQESEAGKAFAIAQTTIDTWAGSIAAFRTGAAISPFFGFVSAAAAIAQGLAAVKTIIGVPIPKVNIDSSTPFADGGYIGGKPHSRGGTWINAERGEYMISKDRMAIPGVRNAALALNNYKQSGGSHYALGGDIAGASDLRLSSALTSIQNAVSMQRTVLVTEDLDAVQNRVTVTESRASI